MAKVVYKSKQGVIYDSDLLQATADRLLEAVASGYGKDFVDADWNTPDHEMLSKLTENVFQFSSAKNYQELRDITNALRGENGDLREFSDFRETVKDLNYKYNRDWLETEYNTAVSSATSSARWVEFENEADTMPMLRYETIGDNKVRQSHRVLNGVTKPITDDFWKTYYPPNGWNCRCEALQVPESNAREVNPTTLPHVPQMFRTNLAQNGLVFPKNHPYYNGVPKDVLRRSMQYIPQDLAFRTKTAGDGLFYEEHAMVQWEDEAEENRKIAKILVRQDYKDVKLMPRLHEKETKFREEIYGKDYAEKHPTKCPDCFANGEPIEFKSAVRKKMSKRIFEASKQANIAILKCSEKLTTDYVERFIKGQWAMEDRKNLKQIIVINNGKTTTFKRP